MSNLRLKRFLIFLIITLFVLPSAFGYVKSVKSRNITSSTLMIDYQGYLDFTMSTILNKPVLSTEIEYENETYVSLSIILTKDSVGAEKKLSMTFNPVKLGKAGDGVKKFSFINTEVLTYYANLETQYKPMFANSKATIENTFKTEDIVDLGGIDINDVNQIVNNISKINLVQGIYRLSIKVDEVDKDGIVKKEFPLNGPYIFKFYKPGDIDFIKTPEGNNLYPVISWSLPEVPYYSNKKLVSKLFIKEVGGKDLPLLTYEHEIPSADFTTYPLVNGIKSSSFTANITTNIFRPGKTYRMKVQLFDVEKSSGKSVLMRETSEVEVKFEIKPISFLTPIGEIENISPVFKWKFPHDDITAYYKVIIKDYPRTFEVRGTTEFQIPVNLEWGKIYNWKVIPYYSDKTAIFNESDIEWNEFSLPINEPPEISIISPEETNQLIKGEVYSFKGTAEDKSPKSDRVKRTWWDIDGQRFEGNEIKYTPVKQYSKTPLKVNFSAEDQYGKKSTKSVNVFVYSPSLQIGIESMKSVYFVGESIKLLTKVMVDITDITWFVDGTDFGSGKNIDYIFEKDGTYKIYAKATVGDKEFKSNELIVSAIKKPLLTASDEKQKTVYVNQETQFNVNYENLDPASIKWFVRDKLFGLGDIIKIKMDKPGIYPIKAVYEKQEAIYELNVIDFPKVFIQNPANNMKVQAEKDIVFIAGGTNYKIIEWYIDGEKIGEGEKITYKFNPDSEGKHEIKIIPDQLNEKADISNIEVLVVRALAIAVPKNDPTIANLNDKVAFKADIINLPEPDWYINDEKVSTGKEVEYIFSKPGKFIVKAVSGSYSDNITINVVGESYIHIIAPRNNSVYEKGSKVDFSAEIKNITGEIKWFVNNNEIGSGLNISNLFEESGEYKVKASAGDYSEELTVKVIEQEFVKIIQPQEDQKVFVNQEIILKADNQNIRTPLKWFINDSQIGEGDTLKTKLNSSGRYKITVKSLTKEDSVFIEGVESQIVEILNENDGEFIEAEKEKIFNAKTKYPASIKWYINESEVGEGNSLKYIFDKNGEFIVKAVADGIEDLVKIYVYSKPKALKIETERINYHTNEKGLFKTVFDYDQKVGLKYIKWYLDGQYYADGNEVNLSMDQLISGNHNFIVEVYDNLNNKISQNIEFSIIELIKFEIEKPAEGTKFNMSETIRLKLNLLSGEMKNIKSVEWYANGNVISKEFDSIVKNIGKGDIYLKTIITDILGMKFEKEIVFNISDKPQVQILSPVKFALYKYGEDVKIVAEVIKYSETGRQKLDASKIEWQINGLKSGNGAVLFLEKPKEGSYEIKATYEDSQDITIINVNEPIKVKINNPKDEVVFNTGEKMLVSAIADDQAKLFWYIDGKEIGKGNNFEITTEKYVGKHELKVVSEFITSKSEDKITIIGNSPPNIALLSPQDGKKYSSDYRIPISVDINDAEDGDINGTILLDGKKFDSREIVTSLLQAGNHILSVSAQDSKGLKKTISIQFEVNKAPEIKIISPRNGEEYTVGTEITARSIINDEKNIDKNNIIWYLNGIEIGKGIDIILKEFQKQGNQELKVRVRNSEGVYSENIVNFIISTKPKLKIYNLIPETVLDNNTKFTFRVMAFKAPNVMYQDSEITWYIDGTEIGKGNKVDYQLNLKGGVHNLAVKTKETEDSLNFFINSPPKLTIISHKEKDIQLSDIPVVIKAEIEDPDNNLKSENIIWKVNGNNSGVGRLLTLGNLKAGEYIINVKATDDNNASDEKTIILNVFDSLSVEIESNKKDGIFGVNEKLIINAIVKGGLKPVKAEWTIKQPEIEDIKVNSLILDKNISELKPGDALISLIVTDNTGASEQKSFNIKIADKAIGNITGITEGMFYVKGQEKINASANIFNPLNKKIDINWFINDKNVGNGEKISVETSIYEQGTYVLKMIANVNGDKIEDTVNIYIKDKLKASIADMKELYKANEPINFVAETIDSIDGRLTGKAIEWISDLDGLIGNGDRLTVSLRKGVHKITMKATNSRGNFILSTKKIMVLGEPILNITEPFELSIFNLGDKISLKSEAVDVDGNAARDINIAWISNLDGMIGFGRTLTISSLSEGAQEISLVFKSKFGDVFTRKLHLQIKNKQLEKRALSIVTEKGLVAMINDKITFEAFRIGDIEGDIIWSSDKEGEIGKGDKITYSFGQTGKQQITASIGEYSDKYDIEVAEYKPPINIYGIVYEIKGNVSVKVETGTEPVETFKILYVNQQISIEKGSEIKIMKTDQKIIEYTNDSIIPKVIILK